MKMLDYTLLCWPLEDGAILGQLLGTDLQMVGRDMRRLRASFSDCITKALRNGYFYEPDLRSVRLKTLTIKIRPSYQVDGKLFPVQETVEVPVYALYGQNEYDYYECFLPQIDRQFYFYTEKDLKKLVEHYSRDVFQALPPREIYTLLLPGAPSIETLSVKVPKQKSRGEGLEEFKIEAPNLQAIAERLPYPRGKRRRAAPAATWERGQAVRQLQRVLLEEKTHVLLIGKSGVGKSAIIEEFIRRTHTQEKGSKPDNRNTFWRTSPSRMIARAKYLGEWQEICEEMVGELSRYKGVLWLENVVMLALIGGEGAEDSMAAFLTPSLQRRSLRIIGELTIEQLEALRRIMPGFVENFRLIRIEEMDTAMTLRLCDYYSEYAEKNLGVSIEPAARQLTYTLLDRFLRYESFPGKAIRFLQRCMDATLLAEGTEITEADIIRQFTQQAGIPEFLLRDDWVLEDEELRTFFTQRIKGQPHVIEQVGSVIKIFKAGLNDPNKPLATLLFAGPTGVGKTAMAKAISAYFFGMGQQYEPLIRLDMSEFQHPGQIYRLIGTDGKLVQHVREHPFTVVLLDEIEKAHPLIFDALLTVMDEGILIDAAGRLTDFRNSILIMTSNLGSTRRSPLGFRGDTQHDYTADIKAFFRPEFFNRIDMVLPFNSLDQETIREITLRELSEITQRDGIKSRKLQFTFSEELVAHLATTGFDEKYGARPLQREIEQQVIAPFARFLIKNPGFRDQLVSVSKDRDGIKFT